MDIIKYTIKATDKNNNTNSLDFVLYCYEEIDGYIYNPLTNQECINFRQLRSNYTEMDKNMERLLDVIEEYTHYPHYDLIFEFEEEDIDKSYRYTIDYMGEIYDIEIVCTSVETN